MRIHGSFLEPEFAAPRQCGGRHTPRVGGGAVVLLLVLLTATGGCRSMLPLALGRGGTPDLSGLVWIADSTFVAVHDAKSLWEPGRTRVSLVWLRSGDQPFTSRAIEVEWPGGRSNDLESAAGIPGTNRLLFAESGDDGSSQPRIFVAEVAQRRLSVTEAVVWPVPIYNVEGTAVARVGERLVFLYAERGHGNPSTPIRWASLELDPLRFGAFSEATFTLPAGTGMNRPVSAMDVDATGAIYIASSFDPNVDSGPFRSAVWRIGRVVTDGAGEPTVRLDPQPTLIERFEGIKIESLAFRGFPDGSQQLVVGTDDENLGAVLRGVER